MTRVMMGLMSGLVGGLMCGWGTLASAQGPLVPPPPPKETPRVLNDWAEAGADVSADVFYQIMPIAWRTSREGPGRFGDLKGLTAGLDYLRELGISAIWINPIFPSPAYHGYQHHAPTGVNPDLGTDADFAEFLTQAKARGFKVFLDIVCYGLSDESAEFLDAKNNPQSPWRDAFAWTKPDRSEWLGYRFRTWTGREMGMAFFDLRTAQARDAIIGWSKKWLDPNGDGDTSDGVDGFRLDHVWETYPRGPEGFGYNVRSFWLPWKNALRSVNPNVFTFAEQADWASLGSELFPAHDAVFTKMFQSTAREAIREGQAAPLNRAVLELLWTMPKFPLPKRTMIAVLGDHDVDRLSSEVGADAEATRGRERAAAAVLMLQPFPPSIYMGDEIGMLGVRGEFGSDANDIPVREPFKWYDTDRPPTTDYWALHAPPPAPTPTPSTPEKQAEPKGESGATIKALDPAPAPGFVSVKDKRFSRDRDGRSVVEQLGKDDSLLETYRRLIALRRSNTALSVGGYAPIRTENPGVWAFFRGFVDRAEHDNRSQTIVCAINLTGERVTTELDLRSSQLTPINGTAVIRDVVRPHPPGEKPPFPVLLNSTKNRFEITIEPYSYRLIEISGTLPNIPNPPAPAVSRVDGKDIPTKLGLGSDPAGTRLASGATGRELWARRTREGVVLGLTGSLLPEGSSVTLLYSSGAAAGQATLDTDHRDVPASLRQLAGRALAFAPSDALSMNISGGVLYIDRVELHKDHAARKRYLGSQTPGSGSGVLRGGGVRPEMQIAHTESAEGEKHGLELFVPYTDLGLPKAPASKVELELLVLVAGPDGALIDVLGADAATGANIDAAAAKPARFPILPVR